MTSSSHDLRERWGTLLEAEREFVAARRRVVALGEDLIPVLRSALAQPHERGTALRLLLVVDVGIRLALFPELVQLASVGHADIGLCREVIRSLPRYWVEANLGAEIRPILEHGGGEEYRRLAELLEELGSDMLDELVARAAASDNADVREVAEDFAGPVRD